MTTQSKQSNTKGVRLPCPFCNRNVHPTLDFRFDWDAKLWRVVCPRCNCYGPSSTVESKAIALWNTRHDVEIFNTMFGGGKL